MHIACICPPVPGHLNPTIALANALSSRGHRVTFIGVADAEPALARSDHAFELIGESEFPPGTVRERTVTLGKLKGWQAVQFTLAELVGSERVILRDLPDVIRRHGIDGLVIDQFHAGGSTVAEHLDLPFVTLCNALLSNREPAIPPFPTTWRYQDRWWARMRNRAGWAAFDRLMRPVSALCNQQRRQWGLPSYQSVDDSFSRLAQISQQPCGFDFPRHHLPQHFHYVGPLTDGRSRRKVDFPFDRLDGRQLVYASMGTLQNQLDHVFRAIIEACEPLPIQLVLSLGSASSELRDRLPRGPLIVDYAPQLELLAQASLTITHAGLNTTLESLRSGVPMVAIPVTNDQPGVAARIAHVGVGELISLRKLNVPRLRTTIQRVLESEPYRERARRFQDQIANQSGPTQAAEIIERAFSSGKPVPASL